MVFRVIRCFTTFRVFIVSRVLGFLVFLWFRDYRI